MSFPIDLFARCGKALYGDRWQTQMAETLGINDRTLRRQLSGDLRISSSIGTDLHRLLLERQMEIDLLLEELPRATAPEP